MTHRTRPAIPAANVRRSTRDDRVFFGVTAGETIVCLVLGAITIGRRSLWLDEAISATIARGGLRDAVERGSLDCNGRTVRLTVSIGVAPRLPEEHQAGAAVESADKALYTAKRTGRNKDCDAPAGFT